MAQGGRHQVRGLWVAIVINLRWVMPHPKGAKDHDLSLGTSVQDCIIAG